MIWLVATLACMALQAFFSMQEMAHISVNRLEVLFFSKNQDARAKKIAYLLRHPHVLFTTTLIMVNLALQLGSECSRRFYATLELSSNWAPITQVFAVVIVAELAPLFAARTWPRPISFFGVPLVYLCGQLLSPISALVGLLIKSLQKRLGVDPLDHLSLGREEMGRMLDRGGVLHGQSLSQKVSDQLLRFRSLKASTLARPLKAVIHAHQNVAQARALLRRHQKSALRELLVSDGEARAVTSYITARSLIGEDDSVRLRQIARIPFFVGMDQKISDWMIPFRESGRSLAVVLDHKGRARGSITFDDLSKFLFQEAQQAFARGLDRLPVIDRTFPAQVLLSEIATKYGLHLDAIARSCAQGDLWPDQIDSKTTLGQFVALALQKPLRTGDQFSIGPVRMTMVEMGLFSARLIAITTGDRVDRPDEES